MTAFLDEADFDNVFSQSSSKIDAKGVCDTINKVKEKTISELKAIDLLL